MNEQTNIIVGAAIDNSLEKKVHVSLGKIYQIFLKKIQVVTGIPKKYQTSIASSTNTSKPTQKLITNKIPLSNHSQEKKDKKSIMEIIKSYW